MTEAQGTGGSEGWRRSWQGHKVPRRHSTGKGHMRKAISVALVLLFGAGGVAAAAGISDRFNDAFGDTAPAATPPPAKAAAPPIAEPAAPAAEPAAPAAEQAAPTVLAAPTGIPKPKPRHSPPAPKPATDDAMPVAATPASAGPPPPKPPIKPVKPVKAEASAKDVKEVKPSEAAAGGFQVTITWNALDPSWEGMFVTNAGAQPVSVLGLSLNNRKECTLKPYSLEKIQKLISVQDAVKQWGHEAINLFGLPKMDLDSVLVPELPVAMQSAGIAPEEPKIKAGDRVAIFNGTKCEKVSEARIDTDAGPIAIKFKRPYTGH